MTIQEIEKTVAHEYEKGAKKDFAQSDQQTKTNQEPKMFANE